MSTKSNPLLPGWIRLRNIRTGLIMDFNPHDPAHQRLLDYYRKSPQWQPVVVAAT